MRTLWEQCFGVPVFKKIPNKHKGQTSGKTWCSGNGIHRGQPEGVWTRAPLTPDWTQPCRVYPVCRLLSPSPPMCLLRLLWLFFFCAFSLALFILCPRPTERIRIQLYFGLFLAHFWVPGRSPLGDPDARGWGQPTAFLQLPFPALPRVTERCPGRGSSWWQVAARRLLFLGCVLLCRLAFASFGFGCWLLCIVGLPCARQEMTLLCVHCISVNCINPRMLLSHITGSQRSLSLLAGNCLASPTY